MNIRNNILEALSTGITKRDENNNVVFELFGTTHSVRVTDEALEAYEAELEAEMEQAELDIAEAEATIVTAKAKVERVKKRKTPRGK